MIALDNVSKRYGAHAALYPTTLAIGSAQTTVLIGPSGCGKSTLLRMVVGLVRPDTGQVTINGVKFAAATEERLRHSIGYVIQEGGLFPHLTAAGNAALLARHLGRPADWIKGRIHELADLLRVTGSQLGRYPQELSGGQRQRISLMRALMLDPPILLLDEPLAALDPVTRCELQDELGRIFGNLHKTVLLVTHDMGEAAHFGNVIVMLRDGRVVQQGVIEDLLQNPADDYVRAFMRAQRGLNPGTAG